MTIEARNAGASLIVEEIALASGPPRSNGAGLAAIGLDAIDRGSATRFTSALAACTVSAELRGSGNPIGVSGGPPCAWMNASGST